MQTQDHIRLDELIQERESLAEQLDGLSDEIWHNAQDLKQARIVVAIGDMTEQQLKKMEQRQMKQADLELTGRERMRLLGDAIKQLKERINSTERARRKERLSKLPQDAAALQKALQQTAIDLLLAAEAHLGSPPSNIEKFFSGAIIGDGLLKLPGFERSSKTQFMRDIDSRRQQLIGE